MEPGQTPPASLPDMSEDRAPALKLVPVSRETELLLAGFVEILCRWQQHTNLIAASTVPHIWTRHIADSLQLLALAPDAKVWIDLGSGAGFPGMALACALANTKGAIVHLVESNTKKARFLREAARELKLPAEVHPVRIEDFVQNFRERADVVTARALAPLDALLGLSHPLLQKGPIGLFFKGQHVDAELTQATKCWSMQATLVPSKTSDQSRIVVIRSLKKLSQRRK